MTWLDIGLVVGVFVGPLITADIYARWKHARRLAPPRQTGTRGPHQPLSPRVPASPYELIAHGQAARWDDRTIERIKERSHPDTAVEVAE